MAQQGYQTTLVYGSFTPGDVPSATRLVSNLSGVELAVNAADGKLFFKDVAGNVRVLADADAIGASGVASITGGTIDGTSIGSTTPAAGNFTGVITSTLVVPSLVGLVKSNGNAGMSVAVPGTDYVSGNMVGTSNGVASLDATGKIPLTQLPSSGTGALIYLGTWNATTNTPPLTSGIGTKGFFYKVSVAGTTTLDGNSTWLIDDQVVFGVSAWERVPGVGSAPVASVNGMIGAVVITKAGLGAASSGANSDITSLTGMTVALSVSQGGTGVKTLSGLVKANGASAFTAAVAGTDYALPPSGTNAQLLANSGSGGFSNVTVGSGLSFSGGVLTSTGGGGVGTVTSVQASGGTTGLTFSGGPVTSTGTLTLGGVLAVANGGTGRATLSGLLKGAGTSGIVAAVAGTDYAPATTGTVAQILGPNGSGGFTPISLGAGLTLNAGVMSAGGGGGGTGTVTSIQVTGGTTGLTFSGGPITDAGSIVMAGKLGVANGGTGANTITGLVRGNGVSAMSAAVAGSDYALPPSGTNAQLIANSGSGGFSNVTVGAGLSYSGGTLSAIPGTTGTVTSVNVSGGTTGLTFSGGPVTTSGTVTAAGTLAVANGGTGKATLTGLVKGNGTAAMTAAVAGTDYAAPPSGTAAQLLANGGSGNFANVTVGSGLSLSGGTLTATAGAAGTVYISATDPGAVGAGAFWVQP